MGGTFMPLNTGGNVTLWLANPGFRRPGAVHARPPRRADTDLRVRFFAFAVLGNRGGICMIGSNINNTLSVIAE
ncbi:hypothetical protein CT154_09860 [Komagataeibacter xylinus]|nr:hypothetical protein CT154_09860 [Komagataeibacter xylinus]